MVSTAVFFSTAVLTGQGFLALALLVGLFRFKRLAYEQRLLYYLVVTASAAELLSEILWRLKVNNLFLNHFYAVAEFSILGMLYARHLDGLIKPIYIRGVVLAFGLLALINVIFFQGLETFNSNVTFAESLLLILLAMLYFYKLLRYLEHRVLQHVPMFWINMSVLTYFSGALILFHVANELIPLPKDEIEAIWGTHALFNIVHYALYVVALWVKPLKTDIAAKKLDL
jgi:hypothetical protein